MMGDALRVLLYLLTIGALVAVNWLIWFKLVPMSLRVLRDQLVRAKIWRR